MLRFLFIFQLPINQHPDFGPHAFVGPSTAFTAFHQDCYGTVDSVHYCHSGCNEVVMLKRLTHAEKLDAMKILFNCVRKDLDADKASLNVITEGPHGPKSVSSPNQFFTWCMRYFE